MRGAGGCVARGVENGAECGEREAEQAKCQPIEQAGDMEQRKRDENERSANVADEHRAAFVGAVDEGSGDGAEDQVRQHEEHFGGAGFEGGVRGFCLQNEKKRTALKKKIARDADELAEPKELEVAVEREEGEGHG